MTSPTRPTTGLSEADGTLIKENSRPSCRIGKTAWHFFDHELAAIIAAARAEGAQSASSLGQEEVERLRALVYVPELTKCARCGLSLVSSTMSAHTGNIRADRSPQDCPNGCGPMWRITERDAGNDLCDRLDAAVIGAQAAEAKVKELEAENARLKEGLELIECQRSGDLPSLRTIGNHDFNRGLKLAFEWCADEARRALKLSGQDAPEGEEGR